MSTCLWKHQSVDIPEVRELFSKLPEVIMTQSGCWSKSDQYTVPIRKLEDIINWDSYNCGPLGQSLPVTHVIWEEDNEDIVLYSSDEGYIDGDLTELQKFASIEAAEEFVKSSSSSF